MRSFFEGGEFLIVAVDFLGDIRKLDAHIAEGVGVRSETTEGEVPVEVKGRRVILTARGSRI